MGCPGTGGMDDTTSMAAIEGITREEKAISPSGVGAFLEDKAGTIDDMEVGALLGVHGIRGREYHHMGTTRNIGSDLRLILAHNPGAAVLAICESYCSCDFPSGPLRQK